MHHARLRSSGLVLAAVLAGATSVVACSRSSDLKADHQGDATAGPVLPAPAPGSQIGAPRPGMVWIPAGVLRAGTPANKTPRIADEELPGTEFAVGGFYIDSLPYPNESGAIPTVNVARDDAAKLCEAKGKRLCTEFEWERACKGPENTTYEYGDTYRASVCGTGATIEQAARRPAGEHVGCRSGFGVLDLHGGVWEWTDSPWRRGSRSELGVLRGGNARAGELVGRCANAIGRNVSKKAPTMGFRCCAGARNTQENELVVRPLTPVERSMKPKELSADLIPLASARWGGSTPGATPFVPTQAWTWHPVPNEELVVTSGCAHTPDGAGSGKVVQRCGLMVARLGAAGADPSVLTEIDSGFEAADIALFGDPRHLRMRGLDVQGIFLREITYGYGRIEIGDMKRH